MILFLKKETFNFLVLSCTSDEDVNGFAAPYQCWSRILVCMEGDSSGPTSTISTLTWRETLLCRDYGGIQEPSEPKLSCSGAKRARAPLKESGCDTSKHLLRRHTKILNSLRTSAWL